MSAFFDDGRDEHVIRFCFAKNEATLAAACERLHVGCVIVSGGAEKNRIIAAGYNGYGGSFTTAAGLAAARMALTSSTPDWVPEDVFSPRRLLTSEGSFADETREFTHVALYASAQADDGIQNAVAPAIGDAEQDLLFVPVSPCRIIDTRRSGAGSGS